MKTYVRFQHVYFGNRNFSWSGRVFVVHSYHGRKQRVQFLFIYRTNTSGRHQVQWTVSLRLRSKEVNDYCDEYLTASKGSK